VRPKAPTPQPAAPGLPKSGAGSTPDGGVGGLILLAAAAGGMLVLASAGLRLRRRA